MSVSTGPGGPPPDATDSGGLGFGQIFSKQTLPHAKRSVGFMLSKLGLVASSRFNDSMAALGIEPSHCHLMLLISEREGQSQQALAEELAIPKSRMVALIDDLERRGFAERRQNPDDRRQHAIYMTAAGRDMFERAIEVANDHERAVCASLTDAERESLLTLLGKLVDADAADSGLPTEVHPGLAGKLWPRRECPGPAGEGPHT